MKQRTARYPRIQYFGLLDKISPPCIDDFSWINQGNATATSSPYWGINMYSPTVTGTNIRILAKNLKYSSNYRVTAGFIGMVHTQNYNGCGLVLLDGSNKVVYFQLGQGNHIGIHKYNSPTSYNSTYIGTTRPASMIFFRFTDDGTNRISSWSFDGVNFVTIHTVSRTDFITPTKVGFCVVSENATWPASVTVFHFVEEPL